MRVQNFSDKELITAFLSGDYLSIERLIVRHKDKVFGYIMSKVKDVDLANDLFQDVFIKVVNKLQEGRYNEEGKFISWVMRISHNRIIDHFRKESRVRMIRSNDDFDIFNVLGEESDSAETEIVQNQIFSDVKKLIGFLSQEQREVLEMRFYSGMTFKEISEECDISINTALGRMRYALMNLRKLQEKHQINLEAY
ncbi:MAG: sigma-70 family RNA polymerase sigma factor [Flavobacteriales bacterium]|nr:sigma-70 family RNA polymerase sigma factor [Flavobacteriales bacterium]